MKSIAKKSLELTGLFEAEVLLWLMLRNWDHPLADDKEFANGLLEDAAATLRSAVRGATVIEGVPARSLNFVAAIWYAEFCAIEEHDVDQTTLEAREKWLSSVRRALPSCFCDPSDLQP
jgi:hypothetical protein